MTRGSSIACIGVVGDGCGGGRVFFVKDEELKVYDPQTKTTMFLSGDIKLAKSIKKKGCIVTIECENELIEFDLSALKVR